MLREKIRSLRTDQDLPFPFLSRNAGYAFHPTQPDLGLCPWLFRALRNNAIMVLDTTGREDGSPPDRRQGDGGDHGDAAHVRSFGHCL